MPSPPRKQIKQIPGQWRLSLCDQQKGNWYRFFEFDVKFFMSIFQPVGLARAWVHVGL